MCVGHRRGPSHENEQLCATVTESHVGSRSTAGGIHGAFHVRNVGVRKGGVENMD